MTWQVPVCAPLVTVIVFVHAAGYDVPKVAPVPAGVELPGADQE